MADSSEALSGLARKLAPRGSRGRAVVFTPVTPGAGASTIAAVVARQVAEASARPVWLFDLDLAANPQAARHRLEGQTYSAELDGAGFWIADPLGSARLTLRRCEDAPVFVSRFEYAPSDLRKVSFRPAPGYWTHARLACGLAIVDVPFDSPALDVVSADLDGVVLVADAADSPRTFAERLADRIETAGGRVLGVVVNRAPELP